MTEFYESVKLRLEIFHLKLHMRAVPLLIFEYKIGEWNYYYPNVEIKAKEFTNGLKNIETNSNGNINLGTDK